MATYNVIQKHKSTIKHNDTQWHTMTHEKSVDNVWHKVDKRQWVCVKHLRPNTELTTEKSKEKTWHRTMNGSLRTSHGMTWRDVTWRDAVSWENDDFMSVFKQCLSLVTWQTSTFKSSEYVTGAHRRSETLWRILQTLVSYLTWVSYLHVSEAVWSIIPGAMQLNVTKSPFHQQWQAITDSNSALVMINVVALRRARLVLGWVTVHVCTIVVRNQRPR